MAGEQPEKPRVPDDLSTPGLIYRLRQRGWVLSWSPRSDLTERGYQGKTVRLWPGDSVPLQQNEPTRGEWEVISAWCVRYHAEQLLWARGGAESDPVSLFDGTVGGLIKVYETHKKSPFKKVRFQTLQVYTQRLNALRAALGKVRVRHITFDDITTWQDELADDDDGSKPRKARSEKLIAMLRQLVLFGALTLPKDSGCHDVCDIFAKMREAKLMQSVAGKRKEYMTAAQCRLLRIKAHEMDLSSVALEQAIAFELGLRQKDVIGEWLPVAWPGLSDIVASGRKWVIGLRWEEIDGDLVLRHRLSKSVRGAQGLMDSEGGAWKAWDLHDYPMIMDELERLCGGPADRAKLPAQGPVIIREETGLPWSRRTFGTAWRKISAAAGIPVNIQNRDSRPGAATEADVAGAPREKIQRGLGHAKGQTTGIYLREDLEINRELARVRVEKRKP